MERCWILLGMMGAGKSAVGRALAEVSGREFRDTDAMLQSRFGRSVAQIFAIYGEDAFRSHETSVLKGLEPGPYVLATGGGIVSREANWNEMRRLGMTIYLEAPQELLVERLSQSKKRRPLLEVENWEGRLEELLEKRKPFYERADVRVELDSSSIEEIAARTLALIREREQIRAG